MSEDKRAQSEALLRDVFSLMEYSAKLEFKDLTDGALGVAVHFDGEVPGVAPGKRSPLLDSVQFWLNKVVNRPNVPRRWVNLGNGAFPDARTPEAPPPAPAAAAPSTPAPAPKQKAKEREPARAREKEKERPAQHKRVDERALKVEADPRFSGLGRELAEKSVKFGRLYGVLGLTSEQRALALLAADAVKGQAAKAEGEGHWRRLVLTPEKLTPLPKKQVMPDYDDEEDE